MPAHPSEARHALQQHPTPRSALRISSTSASAWQSLQPISRLIIRDNNEQRISPEGWSALPPLIRRLAPSAERVVGPAAAGGSWDSIQAAMADYADAVQGVQPQTAAFELLARVHIKEKNTMALSTLNDDEQGILLGLLRNTLEPRLVVYFSSASKELRALLTPAAQQQLRTDYEEATALCLKMGMQSCKELREATRIEWTGKRLSAADLATLAKLGSVLPALETLNLAEPHGSADPDGVQRLAEGLVAGALPALTRLGIYLMHMGDTGASAIAAALDRGAMPRLKVLALHDAAIGDAVLLALAPALRRRPALKGLYLTDSPFGDEGLAALVAPPPPAGKPPTTGGLKKLEHLDLSGTQVTNAGCATLVAALDSGALPALEELELDDTRASAAAIAAVDVALARSRAAALPFEEEE